MSGASTKPNGHALAAWGEVGDRLARATSTGHIAPAYLVQGVDLDSCLALAKAFASILITDKPDDAVRHRIEIGVHPDVTLVTKDKATVISVASLDGYLGQAHRAPLEGHRQVFVVCPADAMEPAGIARYLKTLEEPPASTVFLLCTQNPDRLPATIHSRCASVQVPPEDIDSIAAAMCAAGYDEHDASEAAGFSGGARSRAERLLERELLPAIRSFIEQSLAHPPACANAASELLSALSQAADGTTGPVRDRDLCKDVLHCMAFILRDRAAGRDHPSAQAILPESALSAFEQIAACTRAVAMNVSLRAVLIEAALALHGASRDDLH